MRVLLLRPENQCLELAAKLSALGHEPVVAPLLDIIPANAAPHLGRVDALLMTSANAARAVSDWPHIPRKISVFAVGGKTATAARKAGFKHVYEGPGKVEGLIDEICALDDKARPKRITYLSGDVIRRDPRRKLKTAGIMVARHIVYRTQPAQLLPERAEKALAADDLDWVLFYSPRSARIFQSLVEAAGLSATIKKLKAGCLSAAVARAISNAGFARIAVAEVPQEQALLTATGLDLTNGTKP